MDVLELIKTVIYGIVEGITEWLPISSTGHLLLLQQIMPLDVSRDFWDMFLVVIQLGAIAAVVVLYFGVLNPFSRAKSADERRGTWRLWAKIICGCIPAAAVGLPLDDLIEQHLSTPTVIAVTLIVYGVAFIVIEQLRERKAAAYVPADAVAGDDGYQPRHLAGAQELNVSERADASARMQTLDELGWREVVGIGLFQVLSLVPGTSRSGSTIIGGLILGCSRAVAAEFTFFLAIPVMVGASGLRLVRYFLKGNTFTGSEALTLVVGCAVAFVVSLAAIRFLMDFVRKHDFKPFGWYRIILGIVVLVFFAVV